VEIKWVELRAALRGGRGRGRKKRREGEKK